MVCQDCGRDEAEAVGLCLSCVSRRLRPPDPLWDRFWSKVDKSASCWLWTAGTLPSGRGLFQIGRKVQQAHRVAWGMVYGIVPPVVLPSCDTTLCVRPSHLLGLTRRDAAAWLMAHGKPVGRSKLTAKQVRRAQEARALGESVETLAAQYEVHVNTMARALRGQTWRHIQ